MAIIQVLSMLPPPIDLPNPDRSKIPTPFAPHSPLRVPATLYPTKTEFCAYLVWRMAHWGYLFSSHRLAIAINLALIALGAWWMAGRALRPIDQLTRTIRHVTAQGLDQRLSHNILSKNRLPEVLNEGWCID